MIAASSRLYNSYYSIGEIHLSCPAAAPTHVLESTFGTAPGQPIVSNRLLKRSAEVKDKDARMSAPQQRLIQLSNMKGESNIIIAKIDGEAQNNWISERIVRRLGLQPQQSRILIEEEYNGKRFRPSKSVELICSIGLRKNVCRHRFQVVEHPPFDTLLGAEFRIDV
ncbi:MAG: hypothetical protein M1820_002532 [Bogoriella megaspora]|nr:MAG: hypothetical protein M1820_002532 [Bogoriella megaspora]